jgi:hypothetical protein
MVIAILNFTNGKRSDEEMHCATRAINVQIQEDFEPGWSFGARLRLAGGRATRQTSRPFPGYTTRDMARRAGSEDRHGCSAGAQGGEIP